MSSLPRATLVDRDVAYLVGHGFTVITAADRSWVLVCGLTLPAGAWTCAGSRVTTTAVWLPIPKSFPSVSVGDGYFDPARSILVQPLYYFGRQLADTHEVGIPGWAWLCYTSLDVPKSAPHPIASLLEVVEVSIAERARRT